MEQAFTLVEAALNRLGAVAGARRRRDDLREYIKEEKRLVHGAWAEYRRDAEQWAETLRSLVRRRNELTASLESVVKRKNELEERRRVANEKVCDSFFGDCFVAHSIVTHRIPRVWMELLLPRRPVK